MIITRDLPLSCAQAAILRQTLLSDIDAFALHNFNILRNTTMLNKNFICQLFDNVPIYSCMRDVDSKVYIVATPQSTIFTFQSETSGLDIDNTYKLPLSNDGIISLECQIACGKPKHHAKFATFTACWFTPSECGTRVLFKFETQRNSLLVDFNKYIDNLLRTYL